MRGNAKRLALPLPSQDRDGCPSRTALYWYGIGLQQAYRLGDGRHLHRRPVFMYPRAVAPHQPLYLYTPVPLVDDGRLSSFLPADSRQRRHQNRKPKSKEPIGQSSKIVTRRARQNEAGQGAGAGIKCFVPNKPFCSIPPEKFGL